MVDKDQFEESVSLRLSLGVDHLLRRGVVEAEEVFPLLGDEGDERDELV